MSYEQRVELYKKIEKKRGRPLISYVTSPRDSASAQMATDVIPEFANHILNIPKDKKEIDLLIVSNGGDPTVAWRIISMLRERFDRVGALLPYAAYSAATLLALGADEIIMHPFANLGPVDPQLSSSKQVPGQDGKEKTLEIHFGAEDLRHFLEFAKSDVGISDQEQIGKAFELLCNEVGSIPIGMAKRSTHLSLSMGEKLLSLHMKDPNKVKTITEALNTSFYHHGYPVGRKEAKGIGLPIPDASDDDLNSLIWDVWKNIEAEMECDDPFKPIGIILNSPEAPKLLSPVPQVNIPTNLPPNLIQQVYKKIVEEASTVTQINPVDFKLLLSTVESIYGKSEYLLKGKILASRLPSMKFAVSHVITEQKWTFSSNN